VTQTLKPADDATHERVGISVLVFLFVAAIMFTPWFRAQPRDYPLNDLQSAKQYIDGLAADTRIPLTPDDQPVSRVMTAEPVGEQAVKVLKAARPGLFRAAWTSADIEILIIPNFLHMTAPEREKALAAYKLRGWTRQILMDAKPVDNGCAIFRYEDFGWSQGGFLLVDAGAGSMAGKDVTPCVMAGFDYLMGVPAKSADFDFRTFPKPEVSIILLAYLRHCSDLGETEVSPKQTANTQVTNFPSVRCMSRQIGAAIDRAAARSG
jgi:hypothetical protein